MDQSGSIMVIVIHGLPLVMVKLPGGVLEDVRS